ncbi:MAG: class I tRNA ligase family protein, partial [Thermoplasmata archaeon]
MERTRDGHWQERWARAGLAHAAAPSTAPKFYAIVAYPGTSGFLHVGHLRGLSLADTLHRFHRMLGDAVFFPTGTHASGLPAVTFAQKVKDRDPVTVAQLEEHEVPPSTWERLEDPAEAARFLGLTYLSVERQLGFLIDERAYVTTIDDDYQAFIRWQFHRLSDAGALVQAPHYASACPVCGPVSVDPSETDLSSGGDAEWITYSTVPFRLEDGRVLLTATLRPETIFGVTNLWVNPTVPFTVWHHADQVFLVSKLAAHRLVEQHGGHVGHEVPVSEVLTRSVTVPVTGRRVPILTSSLVDPDRGTGVVMSVPAHAPADWLALQELAEAERAALGDVPEIVVVVGESLTTPGERALLEGDGGPAARALRATGARSLADQEALDEATERLYRLEFVRGRMRSDILGGVPVAEARTLVAERLRSEGSSFDLQEFSKPVICRNGHDVVIRRIPDQWFLHYGDPEWKASTEALVGRMSIRPREYQAELPGILDWYQDRPCTRRGRWLGTPFPLDPTWLIEPIADSTFYPSYFPIRPFVADGRIPLASLTDEFFDYVLLGRGEGEPSLPPETLRDARRAFTYWYPLDANIGAKEHKRVHFPVFLFTHAKLLPAELQPRGIFVHWWVTGQARAKISKKDVASKGGRIPPLRGALERWGADGLRLYMAQAASTDQDIEWDSDVVDTTAERLRDIERLVRQLLVQGSGGTPELERWLESEIHLVVRAAREAFH